MTGPFPDWVEVPPGLVKRRLPFGMPPGMIVVLALLIATPLYFGGPKACWTLLLDLPAAWWLAQQCKHDPDFLVTWMGELSLKKRYY
jgi:hypothetical protein